MNLCGHPKCHLPAGHELPHGKRRKRPLGVSGKDVAYRKQLGIKPGKQLPSSVGSTPAAKTTTRRRSRPKPGKVEVRYIEPKPVQPKPPAPKKPVAETPGRCDFCGEPYEAGARIEPIGTDGGQGHPRCAQSQHIRDIAVSDTFRAHQRSTWRRGKSPGSDRGNKY